MVSYDLHLFMLQKNQWNLDRRNKLHAIPHLPPGSFAVHIGDHLRFGIICGPIWGSFPVWGSFSALYRTDKAGSQQWTVVKGFLIIGTHRHCVAKICNAIVNGSFRNFCALLFLVMLVSRNVFYIESALQTIVCLYMFLCWSHLL